MCNMSKVGRPWPLTHMKLHLIYFVTVCLMIHHSYILASILRGLYMSELQLGSEEIERKAYICLFTCTSARAIHLDFQIFG